MKGPGLLHLILMQVTASKGILKKRKGRLIKRWPLPGAPDLDVLESHHHGVDGCRARLCLGEEVPKLHGAGHAYSCYEVLLSIPSTAVLEVGIAQTRELKLNSSRACLNLNCMSHAALLFAEENIVSHIPPLAMY